MMFRFLRFAVTPLSYLSQSPLTRRALLAGVLMVFGGLCSWALMSGCSWAAHKTEIFIAETLNRRIGDVLVSGAPDLDISETLERHNVQIGTLTSSVNWEEAQRELARNPLLMNARIIRTAPGKVHVRLYPRLPIAKIDAPTKDASTVLVDKEGMKVRVSGRTSDKSLISLSGKDAFSQVDAFWQLLTAEPAVFGLVKEAQFVGRRRWDLTLKSGVRVNLPQEDAGLALSHLAALLKAGRIDENAVTTIDLRTADRLFLRSKPQSNEKTANVQTPRQG